MTGHTPWAVEHDLLHDFVYVVNAEGKKLASVYGYAEAKLTHADLFAAAPELLEALMAETKSCPDCGGTGIAYLMADETEVGQPPGSSAVDCGGCAMSRAAIAKATAS